MSGNLDAMQAEVVELESGTATDVLAFVGLDREFHEIPARVAGNRVLAHEPVTSLFIPTGQVILTRLTTYRRVLDAHRYILDCLRSKDHAGARSWMHKHIDDFGRAYELTALSLDDPLDVVSLCMSQATQTSRSRGARLAQRDLPSVSAIYDYRPWLSSRATTRNCVSSRM